MKNASRISRRDLLKNAGAVAAAGALGTSKALTASQVPSNQSRRSSGPPRTLALIGDRYHNQDYIRVSLNRLFKELDSPIEYTINYDELSASLLEPYQLFICLRDGSIRPKTGYSDATWTDVGALENPWDYPREGGAHWITEEQGAAVKDFVTAGNGFYALHNSSDISLSSKNYREVMGGAYNGHPPLRPFKVRIVNKEHPVTQGVEDFMVTDEQHFPIFDKDPKFLLLHGDNIDGLSYRHRVPSGAGRGTGAEEIIEETVSNSGWAYEYGQGRVVFTAIGHTVHAMWVPEYLKMQKNAVRWLLKMT
jgi:type 1 glutamine amidotransferase